MDSKKPHEIKYISPKEAIEKDETPEHRFDLMVDGQKIGSAEFTYLSKPIPHYEVAELYVDFEHKGKGYASQIMTQVEAFLKSKQRPGILVDSIMEGDTASGMYERRGWKPVPSCPDLFVFNWPSDVSLDVLVGYASRYTDYLGRGK